MEQSLRTVAREPDIALWSGRVRECRESGQKVSQWCSEHGIPASTYYKWQRKLFAMVQQQSAFVEVTPPVPPAAEIAVTIRIAGAEADIHSGADSETIRAVLQALKSC